jgi:hypothetical protein
MVPMPSLAVALLMVHLGVPPQRRFGPGVCGPADATYLKTATETGGQPFFLSPEEVSKSAAIMGGSANTELMLWAAGRGESTYSVPVDPSVRRVTFSASFDGTGGTLRVISPHGVETQADARVQDTVLNCGRVLTVDTPATGNWQLQVTASARFWLAARGKTDVALIATEFVHRAGRPGHEGLFRIQGQPVAGKPATLRVSLSSQAPKPTFALISLGAQMLRPIDLTPIGDEEFVGTIELPDQPFRVAVTGVDTSGAQFQRIFGPLFHAAVVEVVPPAVASLAAGTTTPVAFAVRNLGPAVRLTLVATDTRGKVLPVTPSALALEQGAEGTATVSVTVAADAAAESEVIVLVTATGEGPAAAANYAKKAFTVTRPH